MKKYNTHGIENFDKETYEYEITLNEYKEYINLKPTPEHEKATIKAKVPKKQEDGSITYEEKELADGIIEVKLNELGEEDTKIEIIVTAENGQATNTYTVKVHRPFATIKGKVQLGATLKEDMDLSYGINVKYIANIDIFNSNTINWSGVTSGETILEETDDEKIAQTKSDEDGNYTIYVMPGTYDCKIERLGFLAQIVTNITLKENDEVSLGNKILTEGDVNRSGIIDLDDLVEVTAYSGATKGDENYNEKYDFGQKNWVGLDDIVGITSNFYQMINIEEN